MLDSTVESPTQRFWRRGYDKRHCKSARKRRKTESGKFDVTFLVFRFFLLNYCILFCSPSIKRAMPVTKTDTFELFTSFSFTCCSSCNILFFFAAYKRCFNIISSFHRNTGLVRIVLIKNPFKFYLRVMNEIAFLLSWHVASG